MAEISTPKSPSRPKRTDDSFGAAMKTTLPCCVTFCTLLFGIVMFFMVLTVAPYTTWAFAAPLVLLGIVCIVIGIVSAKFSWKMVKDQSE